MAGLKCNTPAEHMESCVQFEMAGVDMVNNQDISLFFGSVAPGGYVWIFPKGYDTANVGIDINPTKATKSAKEYLDDFIANSDVTKDAQKVEINVGGNPLCGVFDEIVSDNFILVGDAAGCVNPVTGGGIDTAIESGMVAGKTAAKAIKENDYSKENLQEYVEYIDENIKKPFKKYIKIRDFLYDLPDKDINEYVKILSTFQFDTFSMKNLIKAFIKASPRSLFKLRKLF